MLVPLRHRTVAVVAQSALQILNGLEGRPRVFSIIEGYCEIDEHFFESLSWLSPGHSLCLCSMDKERGDSRSVLEACCWSHLLLSTLIACSFHSRLSLPFAIGGFISILSAPRRAVEIMDSLPLSLRADGADRSIADATSAAVGSTQRRSRQHAHLVLGMA